ncbi:MAG: FAD-dependent thymidylate synthase [Syntrophorhabdus sp.]|nr:FAD-dependent thymidylate synthase [Syntrophorhabdus sp.]
MEAQLKVMLVSYSPEPEKTISAAARLCYSPADAEDILSKVGDNNQQDFLGRLTAVGHLSPVEHASFTFVVEGISRACSHQLVRHRLASYSQQSQRYVNEKEFDYIMPPSIKENGEMKAHFEKMMEEMQQSYSYFADKLAQLGHSTESAREDARFVLPNATETKIMITMNARELLHFFRQRLCNRAQWEIRAMALAMLKLVKPVAPTIFRYSGPPCVKGKCTEGPRTCGKSEAVRAFFLQEL